MNPVLAATYHDPEDRLYDQLERVLPRLTGIFGGLAIRASGLAPARSLALLEAQGARISHEAVNSNSGLSKVGLARRIAVEMALALDAPFIFACDFDRALHWAEYQADELEQVAGKIADHDFTVLGRTARAFASHPRVQRDTEAVINQVYTSVSGKNWDVTAAARGLSRRAAEAILKGCPDEGISTDVSWPLYIQQRGGFAMGYIETEGLEFETADRYPAEVAEAGGLTAWIARIDADPRQWAFRLELARVEVEGIVPYMK